MKSQTEATEFLNTDSEQKKGEILQNALENGNVQQYTNEIRNQNNEREAQLQEFQTIYDNQIAQGVSPQTIYQEISDRTGIPTEEIATAIKDLQTTATKVDIPSQIAKELADQHNIKTEIPQQKITPEDQIKSIADEVRKQDEAQAPEVVKGMENDAEAQQDWEKNYRIEYGDLNMQETYLRGQNQRLVQGAAKARVQQQIKQIEEKKANLKKEFVKNNTETTKEDVKGALEEKNPKKTKTSQ